jgi:hypothetical protein
VSGNYLLIPIHMFATARKIVRERALSMIVEFISYEIIL